MTSDTPPPAPHDPTRAPFSIAASALALLAGLYALIACCAIPYYQWRYAQAHGFLSWIFPGTVVATWQGMAWPFYGFGDSEPSRELEDRANLAHFEEARRLHERAVQTLSRAERANPSAALALALSLLEDAYDEACSVDDDWLRRAPPISPGSTNTSSGTASNRERVLDRRTPRVPASFRCPPQLPLAAQSAARSHFAHLANPTARA